MYMHMYSVYIRMYTCIVYTCVYTIHVHIHVAAFEFLEGKEAVFSIPETKVQCFQILLIMASDLLVLINAVGHHKPLVSLSQLVPGCSNVWRFGQLLRYSALRFSLGPRPVS